MIGPIPYDPVRSAARQEPSERPTGGTAHYTIPRLSPGRSQLSVAEIALLRLLAWFDAEPLPLFVLEGDKAGAIWSKAIALQAHPLIATETINVLR